MPAPRRPSRTRLRSAADSVLLHDLKNTGQRLHLLLSNLDEHYGDPEFKRGVLDLLRGTAEKLDAMAAQWEARREAVLIKVPLDVDDLVREVLRAMPVQMPAETLRVETELGDPPRIWGDPYLLKEAFQSILENAVEAAGTAVSVATRLEGSGRRRRVVVEVGDDGPGMTAEFLANRLFRPFQTTKPDGIGLGLYSAREAVGAHGGTIEVRSAPGAGTGVKISLPALVREEPGPGGGT